MNAGAKHILTLILLLCGLILPGTAQVVSMPQPADTAVSETYTLYYPHDDIEIDSTYLDNAQHIARIRQIFQRSPRVDSITIYAYASPEGTQSRNQWLSERRAEAARDLILSCRPNESVLSAENVHLRPMGENWAGLEAELQANYHLMNRDRVLNVMRANVPTETKKWRLKKLDNGFTYRWIVQHHMPRLRMATWICVFVSTPELENPDTVIVPLPTPAPEVPDTIPAPAEPSVVERDTVPMVELLPAIPVAPDTQAIFALKTNLLYDALLVPNIGLEAYLGKGFSLSANGHYAWWNTESWFWRTYGGEVAVRKYFGKAAKKQNLTGHHLGLFGSVILYDFLAFGNKGYMSGHPGENLIDRPTYTAGVEYGYSLPIGRRLNLDFVLGVGYQTGQFNEYKHQNYCYVWQAFKKQRYIGPTKAEITLTWLLGNRAKKQKGGQL